MTQAAFTLEGGEKKQRWSYRKQNTKSGESSHKFMVDKCCGSLTAGCCEAAAN